MGIQEYRNRTLKNIVLPSGVEACIRRLNVGDFLEIKGTIPALNVQVPGEDNKAEDPKVQKEANELFLIRGLVELDGESVTVVRKKFSDCVKGELSLDDLAFEDENFIISEIIGFYNAPMIAKKTLSGIGVETPEGVRFPQQQA